MKLWSVAGAGRGWPRPVVARTVLATLLLATLVAYGTGCDAVTEAVRGDECDQLKEVEKEWSSGYLGSTADLARPYPNDVWMEIDEIWDDDKGTYYYTLEQSFGMWSRKDDVKYPDRYGSESQAKKAGDTLWCSRYTEEAVVLATLDEWVVIADGGIVARASSQNRAEEIAADRSATEATH